ncbi:MAG TPA: hypothetical protein VLM05_15925, partial [Mycobacteriales bacterium]|nr:hypothetical protein [Mycobacteriales bacterium]
MPGPARSGRSARAARTASVLAAFSVVVTMVAAGTPGGASDDPAGVPEAAAAARPDPVGPAAPLSSPTARPTADPLAAPVSTPTRTPTPTRKAAPPGAPAPAARAADTLATAGARARKITDSTRDWASFTLLDRSTGKRVGDRRTAETTFSES